MAFYNVIPSKQTTLLACRDRTAESYFLTKENRRAGAQTKLFDEKVLVEGDKCTHVPVSLLGPSFLKPNFFHKNHRWRFS